MNKLDNDSRKIYLSKAAILKSDKDIATINSLNKFSQATGNILVLSGGYAVEAHCGGEITRAHGDIDAHLILTGSKSNDELFLEVKNLLSKEKIKWTLREKRSDKVDYLEDDNTKEFFDKRRIEVRLNLPHEANIKYPKKKLIDSQSKIVEVGVVDLNQMVAEKINKIYETRENVDTTKDRHSSKTDYIDLKRLLETDDFNKEEVLRMLANSLNISDPKTAINKAMEIYDTTIIILG